MARIKAIYGKQLLEKTYKTFPFEGEWARALGNPEVAGFWLVYGREKQGKTWFSLLLAEYLSNYETTLYVSAEQGTGKTFQEAYTRAGLNPSNRQLKMIPYTELTEIENTLGKQRSPKVVIIDNTTVYKEEFTAPKFRQWMRKYKNTLFVIISHEEKGEPDLAVGRLCKKLAEIVIRVEGLACHVSGRCPGGTLVINEEKAQLYYDTNITPNS